jgi:dTDP-4-dehydrorhamnose 3,5-epimerase
MAVTGHPAGVLRTPSMQVTALDLPGAYLVTPRRIADARGFFVEHYNKRTLAAHGLHFEFIQDNASLSVRKGTVRGLHFQTPPSSQTKLVSVMSGAVLDVMVDIRHGSPAYGRHIAVELTAESGRQLLVPRGMAHGYCTLADIRWCCTRSMRSTIRSGTRACNGTIPISASTGRSPPQTRC